MRRLKEKVRRRKSRFHPYYCRSGELSSLVLARELYRDCGRFRSLYTMTQESFEFYFYANNRDLPTHAKWSVYQHVPQVKYFLPSVAVCV
jgi:hypothetical protein